MIKKSTTFQGPLQNGLHGRIAALCATQILAYLIVCIALCVADALHFIPFAYFCKGLFRP